jgi:hypothetical protein
LPSAQVKMIERGRTLTSVQLCVTAVGRRADASTSVITAAAVMTNTASTTRRLERVAIGDGQDTG